MVTSPKTPPASTAGTAATEAPAADSPAPSPAPSQRGAARAQVEQAIRSALLTGGFIPGKAVTLRGLAAELGVSPMPVREVIQRLAAEHALDIKSNGRVQVPDMSGARFNEILKARLLLEPEVAAMALPFLGAEEIATLTQIDLEIDACLSGGDAAGYMELNHRFHFTLYQASASQVLLPLVESLWLQFGPYMRTVYGRVGTANLVDWHKQALRALEAGDVTSLRQAISSDIADGMGMLGRDFLPAL